MRMVLIHGINQQGKSSQAIRDGWMNALHHTCDDHQRHTLDKLTRIEAPFYGDRLHELSSAPYKDGAVAMGAEDIDDDFANFSVDALRSVARNLGVTEEQLAAAYPGGAVPMGAGVNKEWVKVFARLIESVSPLHGTVVLRVLSQAHAYIRNAHIYDEVNEIVRPFLEDDEPLIVVSHSLGTIVALTLLREFAESHRPRQSPLLLTLGSPLGIDSVRKSFKKPRIKPANVKRWVNGADPSDFVALRPELTTDNFGPGIENYPDIRNAYDDPHSIVSYLGDRRIAQVIVESIA
jgi:hypothetical protein